MSDFLAGLDSLGIWQLIAAAGLLFALTAPLRIYFGARRLRRLNRELETLQGEQDRAAIPPPLPPQ